MWSPISIYVFINKIFVCIATQLQDLQAHIFEIAQKEPYWGEKIPLRWLKFDETKNLAEKKIITLSRVLWLSTTFRVCVCGGGGGGRIYVGALYPLQIC